MKQNMKATFRALLLMAIVSPAVLSQNAFAQNKEIAVMDIKRNGSEASAPGPEEYFTGKVRIDAPFKGADPSRVNGATVTFDPGARTAWHKHPLGQTVIVTAGKGWAQVEGSDVQEINPGDVVFFPANTRHWHGATPTTGMTHIAIHESLNGKVVDWMEKVSDEQYKK